MKTMNYNKLVRDKIPEIIKQGGGTPFTEILSDEEYIKMLNEKLLEEVKEYLESGIVDELADISEVIYAILAYKNITLEEFQKIRFKKFENRGGFKKKILLKKVVEN